MSSKSRLIIQTLVLIIVRDVLGGLLSEILHTRFLLVAIRIGLLITSGRQKKQMKILLLLAANRKKGKDDENEKTGITGKPKQENPD